MSWFAFLGVVLVLLKIFAVNQFMIDLSWWWVTLPFWFSIALWSAMIGGGVILGTLVTLGLLIISCMLDWYEKIRNLIRPRRHWRR